MIGPLPLFLLYAFLIILKFWQGKIDPNNNVEVEGGGDSLITLITGSSSSVVGD